MSCNAILCHSDPIVLYFIYLSHQFITSIYHINSSHEFITLIYHIFPIYHVNLSYLFIGNKDTEASKKERLSAFSSELLRASSSPPSAAEEMALRQVSEQKRRGNERIWSNRRKEKIIEENRSGVKKWH